jgi:hypothetical protein
MSSPLITVRSDRAVQELPRTSILFGFLIQLGKCSRVKVGQSMHPLKSVSDTLQVQLLSVLI